MKPSFDALKQQLKDRDISLSHQRLKVLAFLWRSRGHPTADEIYLALREEIATLSKTTVYNTLRVLEESGMVRAIGIEDHETRFDLSPPDHGHFKCLSCGRVSDVPMDIKALFPKAMDRWRVDETSVHFRGLCPDCLSGEEENK